MNSRAGILALWFCGIGIAVVMVARAHYITDLSAFLPARPTATQQLLVDQLRDGPASRLILIAIESGDAGTRSAVSTGLAKRLRLDGRFATVANGEPTTLLRDREYLFRHRYALSEQVTAARFSAAGLHAAIQDTIDEVASSTALLLKSSLPIDPTGEMLHIVDQMAQAAQPATRDGVWASADGSRALALAQTVAAGSDLDAQERAISAIRAAFAAAARATPAGAENIRLTLSGPGVFAVAARAKIKRAVMRLSLAAGAMVTALLYAAYRSLPALLIGLLPVASGALAGIAAVALGFGAVHGITLGFGTTLIGEAVDYSIYFFVPRRERHNQNAAIDWQRHWWPTVRLGMLTSVFGFASLLPSGFPGLAQLGLYSIVGLVAAAAVTRFVLPALLPRHLPIHDVAPLGRRIERLLRPMINVRGATKAAAAGLLAMLALAVLYLHRDSLWNRDLARLSPVSIAELADDHKMRTDLGAADVRDVVIVTGPNLESVLRGAERAAGALRLLTDANVIGGFDTPANYLPSLASQQVRRAALPDRPTLRDNLRLAAADLSLDSAQLEPFLQDVEAARRAPPLTADDLRGTSLRTGFDALITQSSRQKDHWSALLPLQSASVDIDTARVAAALNAAHLTETRVLDLKQESDALYAGYLKEAMRLSLAGLAALTVLLLIALRSVQRVARVLAPLMLSVLLVAAILASSGELTILHLVGMLLIVAVGSNYSLFFDARARVHEVGSEYLLASLLIANASTVIGFGLLSFSQVPVLVALGTTVAPGAFLALLFAAALSQVRSVALRRAAG